MDEHQDQPLEPTVDPEAQGETQEDVRHASTAEIATVAILFVVMVGGIFWAWFQGYSTGYASGQGDAMDQQEQQVGVTGLPARHFFVNLDEGQKVVVTLEGPGESRTHKPVEAAAGERVVIDVEKVE